MRTSTRIVCVVWFVHLLAGALWGQGVVIGPVLPPFGGGGGGGQYHGPADLVPPAIAPFDPETQCGRHQPEVCEACQLPADRCTAPCPFLELTPSSVEECVGCLGETEPQQCFQTAGYNLTFGSLRAFCQAPDRCSDDSGIVTVCVGETAACEVHVLESAWINHQVFAGKPICSPVPVGVCLDGQPLLEPPHSILAESEGSLGCAQVEVCVSFPRECLCEAVERWEDALGVVAGTPSQYDGKWLFHVAVTRCQGCSC